MQRDLQLAKISQEKNQLQLQSIISSFNPHFINNSLHWAQSRYRNDKELVNVIGSLSENIRYIFTNTRNGNATHSFEEEMKIVENYIQIQRIRFKNSFEFRGPSEELKQRFRSFEMPILQLQIHIENAIEHGLRNRIESSIVEIDLKEDPNYLNFIITDDGVGRNRAAKLNSKGTQTGTSMLTSLHNLFNNNKANKYLITTIYEDEIYTDAEGNRFGTRVIIKIPKQFTYGL